MGKDYNKKRERYVELVFSAGINPYMQSLQKHRIVQKKSILDVGCGPGQWTLAAAKLNPEASVVGIDIDKGLRDFAIKYARDNKIKNCTFLRESYENLSKTFRAGSFDVIMCNGVIQYIDERKAFKIFSLLLKKRGLLIMFYNHGPGYYLKSFFLGVKNLNLGDIVWGANTFVASCTRKRISIFRSQDHFVTLRHLQKTSADVGIILDQIQTEPKLNYQDRFLGFTYVFSCKGIKAQKKSGSYFFR
jgi:ubiquinone/menaquinone biosynthesis C-methylase UbiE